MEDHESLVERAGQGDRAAVARLLQRHLPALRAFVRLRAGPAIRARESTSDIVQSVCAELLEGISTFEYRGEAAFRGWLCTAAMRKLVERQRHLEADRRAVAREEPLLDAATSRVLAEQYARLGTPSRHAIAREALARVEAAFDRLPEDYREVIVLHRIAGLSHREIGERLDRSEIASQRLLARALARLSTLLSRG